MEPVSFKEGEKPSWADVNAYLDITLNDEVIDKLGLLSFATMSDAKIKRTNAAGFELNVDALVPFPSRTNKFVPLPQVPLVEKDLAVIVDEDIKWLDISKYIKSKVSSLEFKEEYRGNQIPEGKKSIMFTFTIGDGLTTMTSEEINKVMDGIIKTLNKTCGATLREE